MSTPNGLLQEANDLIESGKLDEAKSKLEEAVAIDATFAPAHLALGSIHIARANKIALMLMKSGKLFSEEPEYRELSLMRASYEQAISYYRNAIKYGDAEAYLGLGACLFNLGRPEESLRIYTEAEEVFRNAEDNQMLARALFNRAGDLLCLGRPADAVPVIEEAIELDRTLDGIDRLAVSIYDEAGEKEKALRLLDELIIREPENMEYPEWKKKILGD